MKKRKQFTEIIMRKTSYRELILLKNVLRDEAVSAFAEAAENDDAEQYARALALLMERDEQHSLARRIADAVLYDDNLFARRAFAGTLNGDIRAAYRRDLGILYALAKTADTLPRAYPNA